MYQKSSAMMSLLHSSVVSANVFVDTGDHSCSIFARDHAKAFLSPLCYLDAVMRAEAMTSR
jgi:hypothetical protein